MSGGIEIIYAAVGCVVGDLIAAAAWAWIEYRRMVREVKQWERKQREKDGGHGER